MTANAVTPLRVGQFAESTNPVCEEEAMAYARIVGDQNPLHFDSGFAAGSRFGRKIAPGILLAGYISGVIGTRLPGAGTLYESQTLSFRRPVFYGDTITTRAEVLAVEPLRGRARLRTCCFNQNGECVLEGEAVVLPKRRESMQLSEILSQADCAYTLISDGGFSVLEQCTRVRAPGAFTYLEDPKYIEALSDPNITCAACSPELKDRLPAHVKGVVVTETPKLLFFQIHNFLMAQRPKKPSVIDPTAQVSPQAYVAPYDVVIGAGTEVQPFAVVCEGTILGENVRVCCGTVIGGQSFTAVRNEGGDFLALDAGGVRIENGVEICPNCHIARGTLELDETVLGAYSKLDAMVHIGHGSVVGSRTLFAAGAAISGNCVIGDHVWVGVNATVSNRIQIGDGARVSLGAVVTKDVPAGETVTGNFAIPHPVFIENLKASARKDKMK